MAGFATLQSPLDLLGKLRHDMRRIRQRPDDPYAAFDFFVTAEHIPDWKGDTSVRRAVQILRVVSYIANGAKHFVVDSPRHQSIKGVTEHKGALQANAFQADAFDTDRLVMELDGTDAQQLGSRLSVLELADKVLKYWEAELR